MSLKTMLGIALIFILSPHIRAQDDVKVYTSFDIFDQEIIKGHEGNEGVQIINFWATWCAPCVKELPYFEGINGQLLDDKNITVTLVSLDFKSNLDKGVKPMILEKSLKSKVVLLADSKANEWIDRVDPSWSGSIPATIILYKDQYHFFEKSYETQEELNTEIITIIQK